MENTSGEHITIDGKTVPEAYLRRVNLTPDRPMATYMKDGTRETMTWRQCHSAVSALFQAYRDKYQLKPGDVVCIFSQSRPEWIATDLANFCAGLITVPIYYSNSVEDIAFIIDHCGAKLIFVEDEASALKLHDAFEINKKTLPAISYFDRSATNFSFPLVSYRELVETPLSPTIEADLKKSAAAVGPEDSASIVYTSGTTGKPKGALLTHGNFTSEMRAVLKVIPINSSDSTLTFLPFAHIFGRVESMMPIFSGLVLNFAENINTVAKDMGDVGPTFLASVPRIYEKIYAKIQGEVAGQSETKQKVFKWALGVGREYARLQSDKAAIPASLAVKYFIADKLVFSKIRQKLGGRIRYTVSGGAPLARELCEFFHACGIKILEGYGLTETTAAITVNVPDDYAFGTVGKPMHGIELRIASDGEIQLRGGMIFKEYYRNREATKESFTEDGWFCTGDVGEITERGSVRITDRKKELIVTSGGKKIAPQKLENLLKGSRFISNCLVYGDKQKYIVALLTMNEPEIGRWAKGQGLVFAGGGDLCKLKQVVELLDKEVRDINSHLASYESIKKFSLLPCDFTIESGELTPSLKVKRKVVVEKYKGQIEGMYRGGGGGEQNA